MGTSPHVYYEDSINRINTYLEHVVAVDIAKVTSDLWTHVPTTEGRSRVLHTTHVKHHVRDSGKAIPIQTKSLKPVVAEGGREGEESVCVCVRERERERGGV